ncbi:hypothetical protein A176_006601 [Myxococcus hansupus]|uniref:Uncharacterized protein n=1 Tax=Pseudomyxococcus hansupus TaxID=1297742 RepID=A0A0H4X3D8_9BACT|nr:HBL/NHE enterotoxin family protein [Myxococcus hansupus]AKQ69689.1 hypothetical protein A176_006601 [Myxococcus hansupus]
MTASLSPPDSLTQGVTSTNAAVPQIDGAVASILALAVPDGSELANLPADVNQARSDAALWTSTYRPLVLSSLQGVVDFSSTFDAAYEQLSPLSVRIAAGDSTAIAPFQAQLQQLQDATRATAQATAAVASQLVDYETKLDADIAILNGDQAQLQSMQSQYQQEAQVTSEEAAQVDEELREYEGKRALAVLQGQIVYAEFLHLIDMLTGESDELHSEEDSLNSEAYEASAEARSAGEASSEVAQYQTFLSGLFAGVSALDAGWNTLDANFTELLSSEDITTYGIFTPSLLQAVKADWDNLATQARGLL